MKEEKKSFLSVDTIILLFLILVFCGIIWFVVLNAEKTNHDKKLSRERNMQPKFCVSMTGKEHECVLNNGKIAKRVYLDNQPYRYYNGKKNGVVEKVKVGFYYVIDLGKSKNVSDCSKSKFLDCKPYGDYYEGAKEMCAALGMRLPSSAEANSVKSSNVLPNLYGWYWTTDVDDNLAYHIFFGSSNSGSTLTNFKDGKFNVMCIGQ